MKVYDVIVVGGGFTGGILSLLLTKSGIRVAVIEARNVDRTSMSSVDRLSDGRTIALSSGSVKILKRAGIWSKLEEESEPICEILVSQRGISKFLHFDYDQSNERIMGSIVENTTLMDTIYSELVSNDLIDVYAPVIVDDVKAGCDHVVISFHSIVGHGDIKIMSALCVGAGGRNSSMKTAVAKSVNVFPYHQSAMTFNVRTSKYHHGFAFEHFLPSGPLAFLPLTGHACSVVWSVQDSLLKELIGLSDEALAKELQYYFGDMLGTITISGSRSTHPLSLQLVTPIVASRLALVGDAAHGVHPVAGQGLNLGLQDVESLSKLLAESHKTGSDLGSMTLLNAHRRTRYLDTLSLSVATDVIVRLFSSKTVLSKFLGCTCFFLVDHLPALKRLLVHRAMGTPHGNSHRNSLEP